ncbi:isoprenoid synthase domain-containing protein [Mycena capillaripes]|nr:isoprenoid synthase domain-containing protein [Mycena capillaripes]
MSTGVSVEANTVMSTVVSAFPPARIHTRAEEIIAAVNSFFLETWPFASQGERDSFVECQAAMDACKTIPDGEFEKMIWTGKIFALFFLLDDTLETKSEGMGSDLADRAVQLIRGDLVPRTTVEELMNVIFRGIEASTGVEQYKQFIRLTCPYFHHKKTPAYQNIPEYLAARVSDVAGHFVLVMARYALDIYIGDDELQKPMLAECEKLAIDIDVLENDVISYEKEVQQNTLGNNLVAMLLQNGIEGQTFDSASGVKMYIRELIAEQEAKLHSAISVALTDEILGKSDAVRRWLRALPYIVSGNTWWSQHSRRYNLPGKPVPRKVIHLEGVGDIIEPEP